MENMLKEYIGYDPSSGKLYFESDWGVHKRGKEIKGCLYGNRQGVVVRINNRKYSKHKLCWFLYYGEWPNSKIVHSNGDKTDNRICNLQEVAEGVISKREDLTLDVLKSVLDYDPLTGNFTWKRPISQSCKVGTIAGTLHKGKGTNYTVISINNLSFYAHRLAWLYMTGSWPDPHIDHINGNGRDNRFYNLRQAYCSENNCNIGLRSHNTSGHKNVSVDNKTGKYLVVIEKDHLYHRELFNSLNEAVEAAKTKREEIHGEYHNHGT